MEMKGKAYFCPHFYMCSGWIVCFPASAFPCFVAVLYLFACCLSPVGLSAFTRFVAVLCAAGSGC